VLAVQESRGLKSDMRWRVRILSFTYLISAAKRPTIMILTKYETQDISGSRATGGPPSVSFVLTVMSSPESFRSHVDIHTPLNTSASQCSGRRNSFRASRICMTSNAKQRKYISRSFTTIRSHKKYCYSRLVAGIHLLMHLTGTHCI
jgi:hypothetical protein